MADSKMYAEIREQPETLERILNEGWAEVLRHHAPCGKTASGR
jgi:hypothetical protein